MSYLLWTTVCGFYIAEQKTAPILYAIVFRGLIIVWEVWLQKVNFFIDSDRMLLSFSEYSVNISSCHTSICRVGLLANMGENSSSFFVESN